MKWAWVNCWLFHEQSLNLPNGKSLRLVLITADSLFHFPQTSKIRIYKNYLFELLTILTNNVRDLIGDLPAKINFGLAGHLSRQMGLIWNLSHYLLELLAIWASSYGEFQSSSITHFCHPFCIFFLPKKENVGCVC